MELHTKSEYLTCLQQNWANLLPHYQALSLQDQAAYLQTQGYETLSGFLGHVIAWWSDAERVITRLRQDLASPLPDYEVDKFNALAVERFGGLEETQVIKLFTAQREHMQTLVESLTESELSSSSINTRLFYEILGHWEEHKPIS
jgi:hypothetical protein